MSDRDPTSSVVLSILREAHAIGVDALLRTTLLKFVYLVDVYTAEESGGKTFTGETWKFLHFGPFASGVAQKIDRLQSHGDVLLNQRIRDDEDVEFKLYSVRRGIASSLKEIGVPPTAALRVANDLVRLSKSLPDLLDHVYFHTSPMEEAKPGDTLDFSACESASNDSFKAVSMTPIPSKKLADTRKKLKALRDQSRRQKPVVEIGPYDETYMSAMAEMDAPLSVELSGRARIQLDE